MKRLFGRIVIFLKGSRRDPLLYLGITVIILFGLVSLVSGPILKSLANKGNFSLASLSQSLEQSKTAVKKTFLEPTNNNWPESPEFLLIGGSSLMGVSPPTTFSPQVLGAMVGGIEPGDQKRTIIEYIVESGENLWSIASKFELELDTILWANDLTKKSVLKVGQKLVILPIDGVIYHIKSGDTVSVIAQKYKGKSSEIIAFNGLSSEGDINLGDILIIPNGELPPPTVATTYAPSQVPLAGSYFICPLASPCKITQGLHWYNAIDFSHGRCGEPIFSAAAGTVLKVKLTDSTSRWAYSGAGNHLTIVHPNGVVTMYGHLAAAAVSVGETVSQGQIIGYVGGQPGTPGAGMSTGCHVHFGVSGAKNPFR